MQNKTGQGRAGQGRAGQGRAGQGRGNKSRLYTPSKARMKQDRCSNGRVGTKKKRKKEKKRKDYTFWHQFNEKSSIGPAAQ